MSLARPASLKAVVDRASGDSAAFQNTLKDFLYAFATMDAAARNASIRDEPTLSGDALIDAYVAAAAEMLALRHGLARPHWTSGAERFLARPWYAGGIELMKPLLLRESPAAFRIRNLFVSANALDRPNLRLALNEVR